VFDKMKTRWIVILTLAICGCIGSLLGGAFFHEDILSLFDGVHPLDPTHGRMKTYDPKEGTTLCWTRDDWVKNLATPAGFEISPATAGAILTKRRWRHEAINRAYIFADNESYYFVDYGCTFPDTGVFIPNHPGWRFFRQNSPYHAVGPSSYYAKLFGTRINGKDGTIWDRIGHKWKRHGYIHLSAATAAELVQADDHEGLVINKLGLPYDQKDNWFFADSDGTKRGDILRYMCRDHFLEVRFTNRWFAETGTNLSWFYY
jgi:hypothetical protein